MFNFKSILHHLFIPNQNNNYRSKVLHIDFLSYSLAFVILFSFIYKPVLSIGQQVLGVATDISISTLFEDTNNKRQKNGLPPLKYNDKLAQAATAKGQNMFAHNYWAHYGPDGASPWDFILGSGYQYQFAGENLAKDFMSSGDVVQAWMNSPSHRANMVKKEYEDVGFAVINGNLNGEETTLVVQMFGKSASPAAIAQTVPIISPTVPVPTVNNVKPVEQPKSEVLSKQDQSKSPEIVINKRPSLPAVAKGIPLQLGFIFFSILLMGVVFDMYFAQKFNLVRMTGKHMAHFIFIGVLLIGITILAKGSIL